MKLLRRNLQSAFIHFSEYEFGKLTASAGRQLHGQEMMIHKQKCMRDSVEIMTYILYIFLGSFLLCVRSMKRQEKCKNCMSRVESISRTVMSFTAKMMKMFINLSIYEEFSSPEEK